MITGEQLLEVFSAYNQMIWPFQIVAYVLGFLAIIFGFKKSLLATRITTAVLAFFWLWVSILFWYPSAQQGFSPGYIFSVVFLVQGILFSYFLVKPKLRFGTYSVSYTWIGLICIFYAMFGYFLFGILIDHVYPQTPPFGLTPCPLIIFTFGILMLSSQKIPKILLVIPFLFSLSGIFGITIGIWEDIGLILASFICVFLILKRDKNLTNPSLSTPLDHSEKTWSLDISENSKS
jgi:hypothetical protein